MLVASNGVKPDRGGARRSPRERGCSVVVSPLDSYVSSRMITLAAPCRALADREPLTVDPDDLLTEVAEQIKDVHYRAAIAVDRSQKPIGLVTRTDLVSPAPRRVILVDHAEQGQSVNGVEEAEIVEILDHHHIGSIETHVPGHRDLRPGRLDRDAGRRALPPERHGAEQADGDDAARRRALGHGAAQLADDDRRATRSSSTTSSGRSASTGSSSGARCSRPPATSPRSPRPEIVTRDAKEYQLGSGDTISIAQIETVGKGLLDRKDELLEALDGVRERKDYPFAALMVTDILTKGTDLLIAGDVGPGRARLRQAGQRRR